MLYSTQSIKKKSFQHVINIKKIEMVYILFFVVSFCIYFFFFFILTAYLLFRLDKFQMLNSQPHVASGYIEQHRANIFANQTL